MLAADQITKILFALRPPAPEMSCFVLQANVRRFFHLEYFGIVACILHVCQSSASHDFSLHDCKLVRRGNSIKICRSLSAYRTDSFQLSKAPGTSRATQRSPTLDLLQI